MRAGSLDAVPRSPLAVTSPIHLLPDLLPRRPVAKPNVPAIGTCCFWPMAQSRMPSMRRAAGPTTIGVISDTHGLVRPEALSALDGSSLIIHAGDIGHEAVLEGLGALAPVYPVRGNNDRGVWAEAIPETRVVQVGGVGIYVVHDLHSLVTDELAANIRIVVSGHSHRPVLETRSGIVYLNPGSAGPRRFTLPISLARIVIRGHDVFPELVNLTARSQDPHRMGRAR